MEGEFGEARLARWFKLQLLPHPFRLASAGISVPCRSALDVAGIQPETPPGQTWPDLSPMLLQGCY